MNKTIIPEIYILEPTRICNFACFMCPNKQYKSEEKGNMSLSTFKIILDKIAPYAKIIQLYWMGEPFINPNLIYFINEIKAKTSAKLIISTNASLLDMTIIDKIIQTKLDSLIIDVDAASDTTYNRIRSGGDYFKLVKNIKYLLSKNKSISINLQFLNFKFNKNEREDFIEQWKNMPCKLIFSWIDTWAMQMDYLKDFASEISPYVNEKRLACSDLWHKMTINYKGEVNLCCHDFKEKYKFGDLSKENVIDIWNCEQLIRLREEQNENIFLGLCKDCIEWAKESEYQELFEL